MRNAGFRNLPFIAVTTRETTGDRDKFIKAGLLD